MLKIGWWTTARDEMAVTLFNVMLEAIKNDKIPVEISYLFVSKDISENPHCLKLKDLAEGNNIPIISIPTKDFLPELRRRDYLQWRDKYHDILLERLNNFPTDLVVLAGYMWIVSKKLCDSLDIINLHPALPNGPTGTWQEVIWELIEKKADSTGVMMHLVTPELDRGPAVTYCEFKIQGEEWDKLWKETEELIQKIGLDSIKAKFGENLPLFQKIRSEGVKREIPLIIETVKAFSKGEIAIKNKRLVDREGNLLDKPFYLSV